MRALTFAVIAATFANLNSNQLYRPDTRNGKPAPGKGRSGAAQIKRQSKSRRRK